MAVLAATFTTSIVFFPVTFFTGVSKYIFTPLALGVVLSIFASYFFAMTVVPLYCARFITRARRRRRITRTKKGGVGRDSIACSTKSSRHMLNWYEGLRIPRHGAARSLLLQSILGGVAVLLLITSRSSAVPTSHAPIPDSSSSTSACLAGPGLKSAMTTWPRWRTSFAARCNRGHGHDRLEHWRVSRSLRDLHHQRIDGHGVCANQPEGRPQHWQLRVHAARAASSYRPRDAGTSAYYQAGGLVDAVINQGLPAPIDVQIKSQNMDKAYALARQLAAKIQAIPGVPTSTFRKASITPASS